MGLRRRELMVLGMGLALAMAWATFEVAAEQAEPEPPPPPRSDAQSPVARAIARHRDQILTLPGVVGIGPGECAGGPCVVVMLEHDTPELRARIPPDIEGYRVQVSVTGPVRELPTQPEQLPPADPSAPAADPSDHPAMDPLPVSPESITRPSLATSILLAGGLALLVGGGAVVWARSRKL